MSNTEGTLRTIEALTNELAVAHRERATASLAFRREHARVWSGLVREGKSSTEAQRWADAGTVVLKHEVEKLDGEVSALNAELAFHRDVLSVTLHHRA